MTETHRFSRHRRRLRPRDEAYFEGGVSVGRLVEVVEPDKIIYGFKE